MRGLAFAAIAAFSMTGAAYAAPVSFAGMTLNGSASIDGTSGALELTQNVNGQRGSAFITSGFAIDGSTTFSAAFEFDIFNNGGGGADGLAFVVQGVGATALGGSGGGVGYVGLTPSLTVEFDTWNNGSAIDNNSANHVGINIDGNLSSVVQANPGFNLQTEGTPAYAWVDYDGTTLSVFASQTNVQPGTALLSYAYDLTNIGTEGYFGFTSATGAANAVHAVNSFDLNVSVAAVPLPAGLPLMGVGLLAFGFLRRRA